MGEIRESTILFTLMGNVFRPVNQLKGSFSQTMTRTKKSNQNLILNTVYSAFK